jgi:recombination protein RecR
MDTIQKLIEQFGDLPGIGPRQARRIVYYLLRRNSNFLDDLSRNIGQLKNTIGVCSSCYQFFQRNAPQQTLCKICSDKSRDASSLMIVSHDADLEHIEKSGVFKGLYFVIGGILPILTPDPEEKIRSRELISIITGRAEKDILKEIIIAMNATPEGENTEEYLSAMLMPISTQYPIKISHLGRGISTGTEIEYSDKDTLKNALENRK